jgi:hypothetical protein
MWSGPTGLSAVQQANVTANANYLLGQTESSYLLRSGSHQSLARQPVHEPFSEVLADHRAK